MKKYVKRNRVIIINIFTTLNDAYYPRLIVFARTLSMHTEEEINLTILHFSLSPKNILNFKKIAKKLRINVKFILVDKHQMQDFKLIHQITTEAYTKLLVLKVFPAEERALWIDVDTIILRDISELYNKNIDGFYVMATPEKKEKLDIKRLNLKEDATYFNAGVILFNLKEIRKDFEPDALFEIYKSNQSLIRFADQDVVNLAFSSRVRRDEQGIYNYMIRSGFCMDNSLKKWILDNAVIIHFIRHIKPWHWYYQGKARFLYLKEMFAIYPVKTTFLLIAGEIYKLNPKKKTLENSDK